MSTDHGPLAVAACTMGRHPLCRNWRGRTHQFKGATRAIPALELVAQHQPERARIAADAVGLAEVEVVAAQGIGRRIGCRRAAAKIVEAAVVGGVEQVQHVGPHGECAAEQAGGLADAEVHLAEARGIALHRHTIVEAGVAIGDAPRQAAGPGGFGR
jgi:hypothetical protein